ncbi:MAG: PBP1A family penicillin-binding protein [Rhodospirillales bacterium]|nr:PBP1A family penicillin-binding protein [Rhodospirillales bacterium]
MLGTLAKWTAVAAIWAFVLLGGIVAWYAADLPDIDEALAPTRKPAVTVLAADGSVLATMGDFYGRPLAVADLPPALPRAVLAVEDRRFYHHFGLDPIGLARALFVNLKAGSVVQGGSTISQQAAKNLFLTQERTIKRKVQELILALWLEYRFSKDQILAIYLNRVYFGAGAYGVDAASRKFFGRPATQVNTYQAAMLAGLLKAPSRYNPLANEELAENRAHDVLGIMVDAGFLDDAHAQAAWRQRTTSLAHRRAGPNARYFVDWVMAQVSGFVSAPDQDLTIQTTLDSRLQLIAENKVAAVLGSAAARRGDAEQAALVAMTSGGAVRALVGGVDYQESPFNRATQAQRQPGSSFKPIVYAAGMEAGLTPDSRMMDAPVEINGWQPKNFTGRFSGEMSLRTALAQSINTVAAQVGQYAGYRRVIDVARRLGITADMDATPALSLGVSGIPVIEMAGAYAAFASGGIGVWPYGIEAVYDAEGRPLYHRSGGGPGRVLSSACAADITSMLVDAVESGTGRAARIGRPIAGKTGTSQNFRDAWFIGWSAELVTAVWIGNDDDRAMRGVTGGGLPAQVWRAFMADALAGRPARPLPSLDVPIARSTPPRSDADAGDGEEQEPGLWDRLMRVFGG